MSKRSRYIMAVAATLYVARLDAQTKLPALDADVETTYNLPNGQQFTSHAHLYRSQDGKVRQDSGRGSMITDLDNGTVTLLISETKEARIITIPPEQRASARKDRPAAEPFEEATIEGHRVVKARTKGPRGETQEIWTAKDLGIVTFSRVESAGLTTTLALRNVSVREPDPSVFQVPYDYTVINEPLRMDAANPRGAAPTSAHPLGRAFVVQPAPSSASPAKPR
jgi:hypothetical protein